jgi:chorismate mutase
LVTALSLAFGVACASLQLATARIRRKSGGDTGKGQGMAQEAADTVLGEYRDSIDNIDAALVFMLAERFKITQAVGRYKAEAGLPPADPAREAAQVARLRQLAESAKLDPEFSEKFLRFIIDEVIRHHRNERAK